MTDRILKQLLHGQGSHADPLACVLGIDAAIAGRRLAGAEHTIWQLTWHMNYWMEYELQSIAGPEAPYPAHAGASWPREAAPPSQAAWDGEVERFRTLLDRLAALVRPSIVEGGTARIVHPAKGETVTDVLWQMVAHNSYHTGQVALLRRAFGHWPPPGGGDTW